jgi:undecaprenyl-diphosphatase
VTVLGRTASVLDRAGHIARQPPVWAAIAAVLAVVPGAHSRRAALRGAVCYGTTAVIANLVVKPIVRRDRPPQAGRGKIGPITSSFPSGHAATDVAFVFGVAQELPVLFLPLGAMAVAAHWSLVRTRGHYATDVLFGGVLGIGVVLAIRKVWPSAGSPKRSAADFRAGDPDRGPSL